MSPTDRKSHSGTRNYRSVALLLSRQAGRPSRNISWVSKAVEAVAWVKQNNLILCSSTGIQTWELITALGSINRIPLRLVLPVQSEQEFHDTSSVVIKQFDLDPSLVDFYRISKLEVTTDRVGKEPDRVGYKADHVGLMQLRDKAVMEMADLILPLSLRPKGNMLSLLSAAKNRGVEIDERFLIGYQKRTGRHAYDIISENVSPAVYQLGRKYLTHWTRAVSGKWPDEKLIDFYRAVVSSDDYPRNGYDTLRRILNSGRILASTRNMPGKVAAISFSSTNPHKLIPLMKWRARYHQMSFEPYGIGLTRELAEILQIKQVNYYRDKTDLETSSAPAWLHQFIGRITDWRPEQEYRHMGDFDLADIPRDQMILFCRFISEAKELEDTFGIRTVPFEMP